jgi:gamma-glutamyltranspeptidase/glutathione hydrolase
MILVRSLIAPWPWMRRTTLLTAFLAVSLPIGAAQASVSPADVAVVPVLPMDPPGHAVASAHPLATAAGMQILADGGNAFDAAVAVAAALAVVEPYGSGLGGGGFFLMHRAFDSRDTFLDARETAPDAATGDMYLDRNERPVAELSLTGPLAAGIPGTPAALEHITQLWGSMPLEKTLAPAIRLARYGFTADEQLVSRIMVNAHRFSPAASEVFVPGGRVPDVGQVIVQKDLANTLEKIATFGSRGFYDGVIAERLQRGVFNDGGIWSREDLRRYRVRERAPVRFNYRGHEIVSAPLPSAGGLALKQVLQTLEVLDWPPTDGAQARHQLVESLRYAYRDRAIYLGDADFVRIPLQQLESREYARELAASIGTRARASDSFDIDSLQAQRAAGKTDGQTTHFSVIDDEGNRVASTLTINTWFGSGYMPPGTGVMLNNEMDDFATAPLVPNAFGLIHTESNAIQPHKRPLSSMTPTFVTGPRGVLILGTPGGSRIITMVLLGVISHLNGLPVDAVVATPRIHHQFMPDEVQFEPGALTPAQASALAARGHRLNEIGRPWGNMQAIHWDRSNDSLMAASDPRGIGTAEIRLRRGAPALPAPATQLLVPQLRESREPPPPLYMTPRPSRPLPGY